MCIREMFSVKRRFRFDVKLWSGYDLCSCPDDNPPKSFFFDVELLPDDFLKEAFINTNLYEVYIVLDS